MSILLTEFPYRTALGEAEVGRKSMILTPQLREVLNTADGRKTVADLLNWHRLGNDLSSFEQLINLGLIAVSGSPNVAAAAVNSSPSIDLQAAVSDALIDVFGKGIVKEIEKIAQSSSPSTNPRGFLDACKDKAAMLLSDAEVDTIFSPLYNKV